ncbi:hypothetical protein [Aureliella helgolandensis]|uniref:GAF domain-containing protein n=1 Tax=Aureliella helgolandensis TaxID=2527968 RepID=A0A518G0C3_9BACT|nr:hypothetical protein [Aureliella helgolandensis]QDV22052.1 hypothetical protein Q31a_03310 [Aureliella helgolandensis]
MKNQALQHALEELPGESIGASSPQVKRLGELVDGELPLQMFLEKLLPELSQLLGGLAAVAWMKAQGASGAVFGIRYQMDALLGSISEQKKHERLVQLAWQQKQPLLAEPARLGRKVSPPDAVHSPDSTHVADLSQTPGGANPTSYPLLFGPILHLGEPVALLEIVLAEQAQPLSQKQRQLFLRAIQLICERVYGGLRRRMTLPAATLVQAEEHMQQLTEEVKVIQQQIVRSIETRLQTFFGWSFASLAENQAFAKLVHHLLDSHGLRVVCPECGHPAILRCLRAGNAKHGAFVFDHYLETGRTFHGGPTTVPLIRVVSKPARRVASSAG